MLQAVALIRKYLEMPHVIFVRFVKVKIANEHIYCDQASILVQLGYKVKRPSLPVISQFNRMDGCICRS
jgi:hypothetical protein